MLNALVRPPSKPTPGKNGGWLGEEPALAGTFLSAPYNNAVNDGNVSAGSGEGGDGGKGGHGRRQHGTQIYVPHHVREGSNASTSIFCALALRDLCVYTL